ncbi:MAG: molybdenum cofactor biosynthesis protein MoaE [Parasphingopyxis sp.]
MPFFLRCQADEMTCTTRLAHEPFRPDVELADLIDGAIAVGAIVSFVGVSRPASHDGHTMESLLLDHCPGMTERSLSEIAADASDRFDIEHIRVVHRCGFIEPGEPIVFVAAAAVHRRAAFEAADYLMDRLKTDAVFWKREGRDSGSVWMEPSEQDRQDRARWSDRCQE